MTDTILYILCGLSGTQSILLLTVITKIAKIETKLPYIENKIEQLERRKS